jgi:hypothetical protein
MKKERRETLGELGRYLLWELPSWVIAALVLAWVTDFFDLSAWMAAGLFALFIVKDVLPHVGRLRLAVRLLKLLLRLPGRWEGVLLCRGQNVSVRVNGKRREELRTLRHALPLLVPAGSAEAISPCPSARNQRPKPANDQPHPTGLFEAVCGGRQLAGKSSNSTRGVPATPSDSESSLEMSRSGSRPAASIRSSRVAVTRPAASCRAA